MNSFSRDILIKKEFKKQSTLSNTELFPSVLDHSSEELTQISNPASIGRWVSKPLKNRLIVLKNDLKQKETA